MDREGELVRHDFGCLTRIDYSHRQGRWVDIIRDSFPLSIREDKLSRVNYIIKNKRENIFAPRQSPPRLRYSITRSEVVHLWTRRRCLFFVDQHRVVVDSIKKKEKKIGVGGERGIKTRPVTRRHRSTHPPLRFHFPPLSLIPTSNFIKIPRFERINTRLIPLPVLRCYSL